MGTVALTGATGFVGTATLAAARRAGWQVRALTRRPQPAVDGVEWIAGALDHPEALAALMAGADAVLHIAGVVNAPDRAGFAAGNIAATQAMLAAARDAGCRRFVHVSSLAAREPDLSHYGWSKAGAEAAVCDSASDWTVIRPPAVFGPGDTEMRDMFRLARRGFAVIPWDGRLSVIYVHDLADLLIAAVAAGPDTHRQLYEADDGVPGGWAYRDFARAIGQVVGRPRLAAIPIPTPVLYAAGRIDPLLRGQAAKLTPDRARYIAHPDWTANPALRPPAALWRAATPTPDALAATAAWYRGAGWL